METNGAMVVVSEAINLAVRPARRDANRIQSGEDKKVNAHDFLL